VPPEIQALLDGQTEGIEFSPYETVVRIKITVRAGGNVEVARIG
jgi:hypothetical protein